MATAWIKSNSGTIGGFMEKNKLSGPESTIEGISTDEQSF
jgi:hypothetical protein